MIMKTAWRSSARTPESDIYMSIDQLPEGLAKFECGGDVKYAGYPITVQNLRSHPIHNFLPEGDINPPTPVLHRLILGTVGRPLWEYTSDFDLLAGFRDALQAHKALCDQGILHRDISAGNVLLTKTQNTPLRGFLTDLEFARIASSTLSKPRVIVTSVIGPQNRYDDRGRVVSKTEPTTRTHTTFESTVTVKRGAGMTGTAQFMARRILLQEVQGTTRVVHEATHDVESFVWVLSYCVMRKLYLRASQQSAPKEVRNQCHAFRLLFRQAFGQTSSMAIATERQSGSYALEFPTLHRVVSDIIANFMSDTLVVLFKDLQGLIHRAQDPFNPTPLTHDALLAV
ncbi:hypothetical protein M378DRAFT_201229, partial [Amanita muscaria Koide BX008]